MKPIRLASTVIASLSVAALTGCALGVFVESGSGNGSCEGKGDVSISTTQNQPGDSFTIDYYGPEDVTLAVVQGFYSETNFYDLTPTRLTGFGSDDTDPSVNVSVIDDTTGWTFTSIPAGVHAAYSGTVMDFFSTLDFAAGTDLGEGSDPTTNLIMPFAVGVSCDATLVSGVYTEILGVAPTSGFGEFAVASQFEFAAAQPVFPNHVVTGPLRILTQTPIENGFEGTLQLPDGLAGQIGDFTLDVGLEFPVSVQLIEDSADVPNNNMSDLWFQLLGGNGYNFELEAPFSLTDPMAFSVVDIDNAGIPEGEYLVFIGISGTDSEDDPAVKILFGSATYSETEGLEVTEIDVPLSGEVEETPALADTGVDATTIAIGAGALLAGGVALGAVAAVRRARSKN